MQWPTNDYQRFTSEALERGFLTPEFVHDREMARSVHQAVIAVFSGLMTAEEAWNRAVLSW
jgi:maltose-binding protein MalE